MKRASVFILLGILSLVMSCVPSGPSAQLAPTPTPTPPPSGTVPMLTPTQGVKPATRFPPWIGVTQTTSKSYYSYGEDINIKLSFKGDPYNMTKESYEINPFPPVIQILRCNPNRQQDFSKPVRTFPAGTATRRLNPSEVVNYNLNWNQRNDQGQLVAYGYYGLTIGAMPPKYQSLTWGLAPFPILPAGGALEKTIQVNQSQTVNGITIKLERVELSNLGMDVYVSVSDVPTPPPMSEVPIVAIGAGYQLDGSAVQSAGGAMGALVTGAKFSWKADPVPKSSKWLTFIIAEGRDPSQSQSQGPQSIPRPTPLSPPSETAPGTWQFQVPLQ